MARRRQDRATSDGDRSTVRDHVRRREIGYAVSGSGPLLVAMPDIGFRSMLLAERDLPDVDAWAQALSRRFTYVRHAARGFGFSQREVSEPVPDEQAVTAEVAADPLGGRHLTRREHEVIDLLAMGKSNGEVSEALVLSVRTVERHLMRIYGKWARPASQRT